MDYNVETRCVLFKLDFDGSVYNEKFTHQLVKSPSPQSVERETYRRETQFVIRISNDSAIVVEMVDGC